MAALFGAGSTLGPFGNAGPATSSGSNPFNFSTGTINFGARPNAQAIAPWVVIGVGIIIVAGVWYIAQK